MNVCFGVYGNKKKFGKPKITKTNRLKRYQFFLN